MYGKRRGWRYLCTVYKIDLTSKLFSQLDQIYRDVMLIPKKIKHVRDRFIDILVLPYDGLDDIPNYPGFGFIPFLTLKEDEELEDSVKEEFQNIVGKDSVVSYLITGGAYEVSGTFRSYQRNPYADKTVWFRWY